MMRTDVRRYKRYSVGEMAIRARSLQAVEADIENISSTGACVRAAKGLRTNRPCLVTLRSGEKRLSIRCVVVWEQEGESPDPGRSPDHIIGVRFVNVTPDKHVKLKDFIRLSATPYSKRIADEYGPGSLRFSICANEKALVYCPEDAAVKTIGLGGMLMEFTEPLSVETRFPMALYLTRESGPLRFLGRVTSCTERRERKEKPFDIGVEFLGMKADDTVRLRRFLAAFRDEPFRRGDAPSFLKSSLASFLRKFGLQ